MGLYLRKLVSPFLITQVKNTTASGIQTFDYTHDSNGNIKTENSVTYNYDALNRLTTWLHSGVTTSYTYDDAGNLLQVADNGVPVKTFTYNAANQITNTGFTYDNNGNMTSDGTYTYLYDGENRLKEVKQGANTIATYTYDFMGRRSSVTEGGATTYFHYDGWNVVAETDASGAVVASYAYDNRNQLVSMNRGGQTYYYQFNVHGDVMSLTNSTGQVVNTYTYDPWGKVLSSTEQVQNPYRYGGYRYDASTGLYYLQKRYYKPDISRFLTKDAIEARMNEPTSIHRYAYCQNNPVTRIDLGGSWGPQIHRDATIDWAIDVGFSEADARIIAEANVKTDMPPYGFEQQPGRHMNQNWLWFLGSSTQQRYARAQVKCAVIKNDLESLGRGLHSIQDQVAHGNLPLYGLHWFGPWRWRGISLSRFDPDKWYGLGRYEKTETASKAYLRQYLYSKYAR